MNIDLVIFDLDGTLADTLGDIQDSMNRVLVARDLPERNRDEYRRFIGNGIDMLAKRVLPDSESARVPELVVAFQRDYAAHMLDGTHAFPGIPELLEGIAAAGIQLAVLSNKPKDPTRQLVARLFPKIPWLAVHGFDPAWPRKPDPTLALRIAVGGGTQPDRCCFVGDSDVDIETARRAEMLPVGVLWGLRSEAELREAGAERLIDDPAQLRDIIGLTNGP